MDPSRADLESLRSKYTRMLILRENHARAKENPAYVEPDPREEMKCLAACYPGALRELDILPFAEIERRAAEIESVLEGAEVEAWMRAQIVFYRHARDAFGAKRWLAGRKTLNEKQLEELARRTTFSLAELADPPNGRLLPLIYERVAHDLGLSLADVTQLVSPRARGA